MWYNLATSLLQGNTSYRRLVNFWREKNYSHHLQQQKLNKFLDPTNGVSVFGGVVIVMKIKPVKNLTVQIFYQ